MHRQQNHPWIARIINGGNNRDDDPELMGTDPEGNEVVDSINFRVTSILGRTGSREKIGGEELIYSRPAAQDTGDWKSIGNIEINEHVVEFWADKNDTPLNPVIRVDGIISLQSVDFPVKATHPLWLTKDEGCIGGEVYINDKLNRPMFFNIGDLISNQSTTKYFADFNLNDQLQQLDTQPNIPVFIALVAGSDITADMISQGDNGANVGKVAYAIRFVTLLGDRTEISPYTPFIPVVVQVSPDSLQYPGAKTFGGIVTTNTNFGVHIRFRVNNNMNFDTVEVIRVEHKLGTALGFIPQAEVIAKLPIERDEVSIVNFVDFGAAALEVLPDTEDALAMNYIENAGPNQYFDQRLVMGDVQLASRDLSDVTFLEVSGLKMFPVVRNMGPEGHRNPFNFVYRAGYMRQEKYGFAAGFFDGSYGRGLAVKIPGFENFQLPGRREALSTTTISFSIDTPVKAANVTGNVSPTGEVFTNESARAKTDSTSAKNIYTQGVTFEPFHPTGDADDDVSGHNYIINTTVKDSAASTQTYSPKGFAPDIFTMGMALTGITNIPPHIKAFMPLRTAPAGRVVLQGIAVYDTVPNGATFTREKNLTKFAFFSPDIDNQKVDFSAIRQSVNNNEGVYKVQLVSPLGFFSEVPNAKEASGTYSNIDILTNAMLVREDGTVNPGQPISEVGIDDGGGNDGYIAFGKWRNPVKPTGGQPFPGAADGNKEFGIKSINFNSNSSRSVHYIIELDDPLYNQNRADTIESQFDDASVKKWHEPFYVANIVRDANAPNPDVNSYIPTGQYIKTESIIGLSDGATLQEFLLVDERPEDCCDFDDPTVDRFLFITPPGAAEQKWIDVTGKGSAAINTLRQAIIAGTSPFSGTYTHTIVSNIFTIIFSDTAFVPLVDARLVVKYDSSRPVQFYGGDVMINTAVFAPVDATAGQFNWNIGFPYKGWHINDNVKLTPTDSADPTLHDIELNIVRQWAVTWLNENRWPTNFDYGDTALAFNKQFFESTHYVMHTQDGTASNLLAEYAIAYPDDFDVATSDIPMKLGGFRLNPQTNIDYAHVFNKRLYASKPAAGFVEQLAFCAGFVWSAKRAIGQSDVAGVRTFPASNFLSADDQSGAARWLTILSTPRGDNLFALMEYGIVELQTGQTLRTLGGEALGTFDVADAGLIQDTNWISREIGLDRDYWTSVQQDNNIVYFANSFGIFAFNGGEPLDISRHKYHSRLLPFLKGGGSLVTSEVTGFLDKDHREIGFNFVSNGINVNLNTDVYFVKTVSYPAVQFIKPDDRFIIKGSSGGRAVITLDSADTTIYFYITDDSDPVDLMISLLTARILTKLQTFLPGTAWCVVTTLAGADLETTITEVESTSITQGALFVYDLNINKWTGTYTYNFDRYLYANNEVYGFRDLESYFINKGFLINGATITATILGFLSPVQFVDKEFIYFKVNTNDIKPNRVEFFNTVEQADAGTVQSVLDADVEPLALLDRNGFGNFIPSKTLPPNDRMQGRGIALKLIHKRQETFIVINFGMMYKPLK